MTLVVVASRRDDAARALATRWSAQVLTCADLARPGWRLTPGGAPSDTAVVDGRRIRCGDIAGVLVRLPGVNAYELPHVVAADRSYVAAEVRAILHAWLAGLPCTVVERPGAAATYWNRQTWVGQAAALGIPVAPSRRRTAHRAPLEPAPDVPEVTVTVVAGRAVDGVEREEAGWTRSLAEAAGLRALVARFDARRRLVGVSPWPDVREEAVADALLEVLAA